MIGLHTKSFIFHELFLYHTKLGNRYYSLYLLGTVSDFIVFISSPEVLWCIFQRIKSKQNSLFNEIQIFKEKQYLI